MPKKARLTNRIFRAPGASFLDARSLESVAPYRWQYLGQILKFSVAQSPRPRRHFDVVYNRWFIHTKGTVCLSTKTFTKSGARS